VTRCDITDLLSTDCAHCRKLPDPGTEHADLEMVGPWFEARYDGRCASCATWIVAERGQMIRAVVDGGYIGECCRESS
jgi:hypothetical protein